MIMTQKDDSVSFSRFRVYVVSIVTIVKPIEI
jgi:hypothetical protein